MVCGVEPTHAYRGQTLIWFIVGWRVRARGRGARGVLLVLRQSAGGVA